MMVSLVKLYHNCVTIRVYIRTSMCLCREGLYIVGTVCSCRHGNCGLLGVISASTEDETCIPGFDVCG
jgi:hypothetical protein